MRDLDPQSLYLSCGEPIQAAAVPALALPVVVFAFTFVQAATGGYTSLAVQIPGAMILTAGVVWQLFAALRLRRS